jgi:hypothetical protein
VFWRDDGHLTESAAAALADGELGDAEVLRHVNGCDRCLAAVGALAVTAARVDVLMAPLRRESVAPRRGVSRAVAIAAGATLAVLAFASGRLSARSEGHRAALAVDAGATIAAVSSSNPSLRLRLELDPLGLRLPAPSESLFRLSDCLVRGTPQ